MKDPMEVLQDLDECQGQVDCVNFDAEETQALLDLEKDGLVAKRWCISPRGKRKLEERRK